MNTIPTATPTMPPQSDIDIRELAEMYDADNRDVYLSLYVDLSNKQHERNIRRRMQAIRAALGEREQIDNLEKAVETAMGAIHSLETKGRAAVVFIHLEDDFLRCASLAARVDTTMVLDASPYILPLARFADEYEQFLLVLIDGQHAQVHHVEAARGEQVGKASHTSLGRHKRGGWSQMRYQRVREGVVKRFYDEVVEQVDHLLAEDGDMRIIIAGPGSAKQQFRERMSKRSEALVIAVENLDMDMTQHNDIISRFTLLAKQEEGERETLDIERLRKELLSGHLAMTGVHDVLQAADEGRIETLLVLEGHRQAGLKCEPCNTYLRKSGQKCPHCGSEGNDVELMNEAVEAAIRISAHVEFTDHPLLQDLGGLAAILRW